MMSQNLFLGMDLDRSYSLRDNKKYYKLTNGELVSEVDESGAMIVNAKGNKIGFSFPEAIDINALLTDTAGTRYKSYLCGGDLVCDKTQRIIGADSVSDYIILFTTTDENITPSIDSDPEKLNVGFVWAFKYDYTTDSIVDSPGNNVLDPAKHLIFVDALNFSIDNPIKMIGNRETDGIIKTYFTDYINNVRHLNILENDIIYKSADHLEFVNNITISNILTSVSDGGIFKSGKVQYSYQLYNYNGTESSFVPAGNSVNLGESSTSSSDTLFFVGSEYNQNESVGKSTVIDINNIDDGFDFIRAVRVYYPTEYASPEITIVYDGGIPTDNSITIYDDGGIAQGSLSHEEYESAGGVLFKAVDLTTTKNMLIAAGIKEDYFDVNYDARAYGYDSAGTNARVYQNNGDYYQFDEQGNWTTSFDASTGTNWSIPEGADAINKYPYNYFYHPEVYGTPVIGGAGANVEYEFRILQLPINRAGIKDGTANRNHYVNGNAGQTWSTDTTLHGTFQDNDSYENYASAINASQFAAYQRGETYRFGVVFFDKKGRKSFVKWIGDIRVPIANENDTQTTYQSYIDGVAQNETGFNITTVDVNTTNKNIDIVYGNNIYLEFTLRNIPDDAVAAQIVRSPRKMSDRTILGAGLILPVYKDGSNDAVDYYRPTGVLINTSSNAAGAAVNDILSPATCDLNRFGTTDSYSDSNRNTYNINTIGISSSTYSDNLFNIISPEISFYKNSLNKPSKILFSSYIDNTNTINGVDIKMQYEDADFSESLYALMYRCGNIMPIDGMTVPISIGVNTSKIIDTPSSSIIQIGGSDSYKHFHYFKSETEGDSSKHIWHYGYAGCTLIGESNDSISDKINLIYSGGLPNNYDIGYVYMGADNIQYGGNTYAQRKFSQYIKASGIIDVSDHNASYDISTFGGDTYISMFEDTRIYHWYGDEQTNMSPDYIDDNHQREKTQLNSVLFPVESTINIDWRADNSYSRTTGNRWLLTEHKGSYNINDRGTGTDLVSFDQHKDAYLINYTYDKDDSLDLYFPKPSHFDEKPLEYNHRIMASRAKSDSEASDSWLVFPVNDYKDVEGTNGPISSIEAISGHLYVFQYNGIGEIDVRRERLVSSTEGNAVQLGTGGLFSGIRYITTTSGVIDKLSVIKGDRALYFYDNINKKIGAISSNGYNDLSTIKNISKYLYNNIDDNFYNGNDYSGDYVVAGFDPSDGNIYFTFNQTAPFTISYNENVGEFVSFHEFYPKFYLNNKKLFMSVITGEHDSDSGWIHSEDATRSSYYTATASDLVLTFISSDKPSLVKVFDTLEYDHFIETSAGVLVPDKTFTSVEISNNSETATASTIDSKYRFRTWRANLPRNNNGRNVRFVGKYAKIKLSMKNESNQKITLYPIITHWRPVNISYNRV